MYHALLHGLPPEDVMANIMNARSMFMFDRDRNFFVSAIIGGTPAIAAGLALALKRKGSKQKVWCFVGDGTEDTGHFAEAVRYVEGFDLPCEFVIEDDGFAVEASKQVRWGSGTSPSWPNCVRRYHYTKSRPHIRTGNFADLKVMEATKQDPGYYFPAPQYPEYSMNPVSTTSSLSYRDAGQLAMTELGQEQYVFIGYSISPGDAMGSLRDVPESQKIETPVAENLMVGLALGLAVEGIRVVVYFERHDFLLVAADAIVNHVAKIQQISHGKFQAPIIFKTVVDDGGLFYSGPTHSQNFTDAFRSMVDFPVLDVHSADQMLSAYRWARTQQLPVIIVEHKKYL
jgi:deoxyxylulose-5-phosphate synthase